MLATIDVIVGNVVDQPADVLISTANPWLNMSGGVNGEIRERGGEGIQQDLREFLLRSGRAAVAPGTVVVTSAGSLPFRHILHAVGIDPFYDSSVELVKSTLDSAFQLAASLGTESVSLPALATGYGHLTMSDFSLAFAQAVPSWISSFKRIQMVVRSEESAQQIRNAIAVG